jgi:hypothetical protein
MSYREENGSVILTMSREDYELLVRWLKVNARPAQFFAEMRDRVQAGDPNYIPYSGNPNYTPYQVEEKKS